MNRLFTLSLLFFLWHCTSSAQLSKLYTPIKDDSIKLLKLKEEIKQQYLKDSTGIIGENKKYTLKIYRDRFDFINTLFTDKQIIFNEPINLYLSQLANEIITKNPVLKNLGARFLFSRAYWPNAFSAGEGTIVFNIGLFSKLKTESQVAFVLCHELAHLYLDHSNNAIRSYINTVYSDEFQQRLKEIKKQKYEQNKELDKLEKGIAFKDRRHSRLHESEADSMAVVFLKTTRFDPSESTACLDILDKIDKDTYSVEEGLTTYFNFTEYPFQKRWIQKEVPFFGVSAEKKQVDKEADSLKTHPDCKVRIERLAPYLASLNSNTDKLLKGNSNEFTEMQNLFNYETIEYCYTSRNIGRCLYQSMEMYHTNNTDPYIVSMIGKCFNLFYENQKNHTLNKIVSLPNPLGEKNYNTLLEFIQNIRLDNIAALGYYFLRQNEAVCSSDKEFVAALKQSELNFKQHK